MPGGSSFSAAWRDTRTAARKRRSMRGWTKVSWRRLSMMLYCEASFGAILCAIWCRCIRGALRFWLRMLWRVGRRNDLSGGKGIGLAHIWYTHYWFSERIAIMRVMRMKKEVSQLSLVWRSVSGNMFFWSGKCLLLTPPSFMTTLMVGLRQLQAFLFAFEQVLRVFAIQIWSARV